MKKQRRYLLAVIAAILVLTTVSFGARAVFFEGIGEVIPSPQSIYINGEKTALSAYLINNNNYFRLRDIAQALDIGIDWDAAANSVYIDASKPYLPQPSPSSPPADGAPAGVEVSRQKLFLNGEEVHLAAYLIDGSNYFKLRDLGQALNFSVDWDSETQSVRIDTSKQYTPELRITRHDVPLAERVEDDFFSDAAIIGNSLIDGLRLYSGLTTCDYYAVTSLSVFNISSVKGIKLNNGEMGTVYQAVAQKTYGKIYILLGINEIGYDTNTFRATYADMLDRIAGLQPDADVYIMSLTPVSANKSSTSTVFTMPRIKEYNSALYSLAGEKGCYYIDLIEALADETGYLPSSATWDGVHLNAGYYKVWADYLRTHYVP